MKHSLVGVFIADGFLDRELIQAYAKRVQDSTVILLTDDPSEGNSVMMRSLRCKRVVYGIIRCPGTFRSMDEFREAQKYRDACLAEMSDVIVDFGELPGGSSRFGGKQATRGDVSH